MTVQKKRHVVKAISWRVVASLTTGIIAWIATGKMDLGLTIGVFDVFIKLALYYFHERLWYKSDYGVILDEHHGKPIRKD